MVRLRLRRLRIDKYRNVVPGTVLDFNDGMNVLLGPNGSGKTTLLRLIAAVVRDDFWLMVEEDLDISYDVEMLSRSFRLRLVNRRGHGDHRRRGVAGRGDALEWEFQVSDLRADGSQRGVLGGNPLGVRDLLEESQRPVRDPFREEGPLHQTLMLNYDVLAAEAARIDSMQEPVPQDLQDRLRFVSNFVRLRSSLLSSGGRFDEGLGTFAAIVGSQAAEDMPDRRWAYLIRDDIIKAGFIPDELRSAVEALPKEDNGSDLALTDTSLPFLKRVMDLFGAQHAKMTLRLQQKSGDGVERFENFEFLFTLDDGSTIRHDLLSWGQKRILSFFYYAAANPDILVVDELVNGLHHEWITACLKEMEGRQCFLTSQNPLLLDHLTFGSVEDVQRTFIQCRREKGEKRAQLHWHPVDEASADSFYRAYRAGIQHVGELLRVKGLW